MSSLLSSPSSLTSSSGSECWWKWGVLASLQYPHIPRCLPLCHHHHHIIIYHHRCNHRHHHISHLILCSSVCIPVSRWSADPIKNLLNLSCQCWSSRWWPIANCKAKLNRIANYLWWVLWNNHFWKLNAVMNWLFSLTKSQGKNDTRVGQQLQFLTSLASIFALQVWNF